MLPSCLGHFSSVQGFKSFSFISFGLHFFREKNGVPMKVNGLLRCNMGFNNKLLFFSHLIVYLFFLFTFSFFLMYPLIMLCCRCGCPHGVVFRYCVYGFGVAMVFVFA